MSLSKEQIETLLKVVAITSDDALDCEGCFGKVAEFAEAKLMNSSLCEAMEAVANHLQNCPCCQDEFEALLAAMAEVGT